MRTRFLALLFLLFLKNLTAQVGGEEVYQFLNVATSARQVALGGEVLTLVDDVSQPIWNPATITNEIDRELAVNYTSYLAGVSIGSASFAYTFNNRFGTMHASVKYLNYGSLIAADEEGNETGSFNANDIALSIGYAYNIPWSDIFIGTNIKFINSSIDNFSSNGIALDFGVLYYNPYNPWRFSIVARNIGTQISTFNGTSEKLPFEVVAGASYKLDKVPLRWYLTLDNLQKWQVGVPNPSNSTTDLDGNTTNEEISFLDNAFRHVVVGAELFPESAINLRIGYNFRRSKELQLQNVRTFGGISFGFGLKMNKFKLNYAYSRYHTASNVSTFSLQMDLGGRNYKPKRPKSF
ncbi:MULTISPECIES: type IX secretion system protein PorQ [Tenacibaculum]|uniref:type IX secretion system protein PorQ n=1 Tax=Tenacibaculum TaxID=104267 RepID=UPI001F0A8AF0|nr:MULTISPECIES: type IX secretion system protein PorQ [Tenacibaculum]MCH3882350.1 type IX secretion system protein PorQ [Tenacibaculum aquimarinum]MDO6600983.1 type IX secretion system protein PorQ [Tenacibaculum sp. 1_MG-2023]